MSGFLKNCVVLAYLTVLLLDGVCVNGDKALIVDLGTAWNLSNQNKSINVTDLKLPSGVYSALSSKGLIGNILNSKNDVVLRDIANENWTYTHTFKIDLANLDGTTGVNLTFNGIDTVSTIRLNGKIIGETDNMFTRYSFNVFGDLKENNVLEIEIMSPILAAQNLANELESQNKTSPPKCPPTNVQGVCYRNMLRKMQISFGSEWSLAALSMGIWKVISLELYHIAMLRDVDVATLRTKSEWIMDVRVFLSTEEQQNFNGNLTLLAPDLLQEPITKNNITIKYNYPIIEFTVNIPKSKVKVWWPNGYGEQFLYPLHFTLNCWRDANNFKLTFKSISTKSIKIGFRTIELIEDKDKFATSRTFYFKVNDHPIFIKGGNYLPIHILPELSADQDRILNILTAAKNAHMNMVRVYGGGIYESDFFYNLADQLGLLVWQDMTYTASTYPFTDEMVESVRKEVAQNAKRLGHHPSLALLVTNDEIQLYLAKNKTDLGQDITRLEEEYFKLFMGTIKYELNIISRNNFSPRPGPMHSTPSLGIKEEKTDLSLDPQNIHYGDVHFHEPNRDGWDPDIYPRARFVTEYSFPSLPAYSSWQRSITADDDIVEIIKHRQHDVNEFKPILQLISRHLKINDFDWENNLADFIYLSQVMQAMSIKTATDLFRSQRINYMTMGAIYWHINDVWVAPSTSSIDFYGNYKLLYYWSKEFLASTAIVALYDANNDAVNVTIIRDDLLAENYADDNEDLPLHHIRVNLYSWTNLVSKTITWQKLLPFNDASFRPLAVSDIFKDQSNNKSNCFLEFSLISPDNLDRVLSKTYVFFPGSLSNAVESRFSFEIMSNNCMNKKITSISLKITVEAPAIFVYIEIVHPTVVKYTLSQNGYVQVEPAKTIQIEIDNCPTITRDNIKIYTINQMLAKYKANKSSNI